MTIHICIYKERDQEVAEKIVKSQKHYGDIEETLVFTDEPDKVKDLSELDSKFAKYRFKMVIDWSYVHISELITNEITEQSELGKTVLVNISGLSPEIAFAIRYATIIKPVQVYCINNEDNFIEINTDGLPEYSSLSNNEKRFLYMLNVNKEGMTMDMLTIKNDKGGELHTRGKRTAKLNLLEKGLIEELKSNRNNMAVGRKPQIISLTDKGKKFYELHKVRISKIVNDVQK